MRATQQLAIVAALWASIGLTASIVMGRSGHNAFTWLLLGAFLGPLAIPLAISALRGFHAEARPLRGGTAGPGPVDVLVGIDGSEAATAALRASVELFEGRIGRLTLAGVIDHDVAATGRPWGTERSAIEDLQRVAEAVETPKPATVLLVGGASDALKRDAVEEGYEVLVVGRRGQGASKVLLGSTSARLAQGAGVPVLVV